MEQKKDKLIYAWILAIYEVIAYLSNDTYLPALPDMAKDLNVTHNIAQLSLSFWFIGLAALQLFLGPICDRMGRRPVLLIGALLFIISTIGCALANNISLLLFFRFIQGVSVSSITVAGYATIHDLFDQKEAIHVLAIMLSITVLAPAFGPLLGALILYFGNWRLIFILLSITSIIPVIGLFIKMPETMLNKIHKINLLAMTKSYINIICNKDFMLTLLAARFLFASMIAWITAGPFLLMNEYEFSIMQFALTQSIIFLCFVIATQFSKKLSKTLNLNNIVIIGIILTIIGGIYSIFTATIWSHEIWDIIIAMMFIAAGSGLCTPILSRVALDASDEPMSLRVAFASTSAGVSGMISSAIISLLYNGTLISLSFVLFIFTINSMIANMQSKMAIK